MVNAFQEVLETEILFTGIARPLLSDDNLSEDSNGNPDDIRKWERRERRYSLRKLQEVRQEEKAHASKLKARRAQSDLSILFGGHSGRTGSQLLMRNKFARLSDPPSPPKMGLDEWEASTENKRLLPRVARPDNARFSNIDPPPGLEHTTLLRRKPDSS